jgi:serine/threonine-protein kinase
MIGRQITQYRVIEKIGEGGMGVVYKAEDTVLHRPVVLKVLPPEHAENEERIERFLREARTTSALNHPNIVTMHNLVEDDSTVCIVMEYVEGKTIAELQPKGGFPASEALAITVQVAEALAAAHEAGIVHRDIKPGNVMVLPSGAAKVLDFGLAKLDPLVAIDADGRTETLMTQAGTLVGSPMYMSPEQVLGSHLDGRSDIFSFGATLYEMLTGERPFKATETTSILHAVVHEPAEPLTDLRSDLPPALAAIVAKCLEKNREARFQSAAELRDALRRVLSALEAGGATASGVLPEEVAPSLASGDAAADGTGKASRYGKLVAALALWALLMVVFVPALRERAARLVGRGGGEAAGGQTEATAEPTTAFGFVSQGNDLLRHSYRAGNVDEAVDSFQRALGLEPESAPGYAGLAEAYRLKYSKEKLPELLERARANVAEAMRLDEHLTSAQVVNGRILLAEGEAERARQVFEEVLLLDPANAGALVGVGRCAMKEGDRDAAEKAYLEASKIEPDFHGHWETLGIFYYLTGRYGEAETAFARSVELAPDLAASFNNMAAVQHMQGKYAEAAASLQRALEIEPDPRGYNNLGTLYFFQGLYQKAVSALEKAVEQGSSDYRIWGNLGDAYRWTPGNEEKALSAFETAIRLVGESIAETGESAEKTGLLAEFLAKTDDAAGALDALSDYDADGPYDLFNAAQAAEIAGDRDLAHAFLEQALRAGLSLEEVRKDPELSELRKDVRYQRLLTSLDS